MKENKQWIGAAEYKRRRAEELRRESEERGRANAEAQAAIERFLDKYTKVEPRTAREKLARRGLRVIEGGKKP